MISVGHHWAVVCNQMVRGCASPSALLILQLKKDHHWWWTAFSFTNYQRQTHPHVILMRLPSFALHRHTNRAVLRCLYVAERRTSTTQSLCIYIPYHRIVIFCGQFAHKLLIYTVVSPRSLMKTSYCPINTFFLFARKKKVFPYR